jgi:hypothetical protein
MTGHDVRIVKPLGVFGPGSRDAWDLSKQRLSGLKDALDDDTRRRVSCYLGGGTIIIALMKYTTDILGDAFGVSGGSGVMSDGTYYWRRDAVEYVANYGIDVGAEAIRHMRANNWTPPDLNQEQVLEIDRYLAKALRGSH